MGYTTDFSGRFILDRPLSKAHADFLAAFAGSRRMHRTNVDMPDPVRDAAGLEGSAFYTCGGTNPPRDATVVDYNKPPPGQPGLWCQWVPTSDGRGIEWDGREKFYEYEAWLIYIIETFLKPWGYTLNGEVIWTGERSSDIGKLMVADNVVSTRRGKVVFE